MKPISKLALGIGALIAAKGLDKRPELTHYNLEFNNLPPEFDGFRIAHISDLHSECALWLADELAALKPDIIALTGDIIHDNTHTFEPILSLIRQLSEIAPIYIVSGNHDLWNTDFTRFIRSVCDIGASFCDDGMCTISKNGAQIGIFGIRDPFGKSSEIIRRSIAHSLSVLPEFTGFKCLLFHRANQFELIRDFGFDLVLSGHMHGGQLRIPGIGGVVSPKSSLGDPSSRMLFPSYCDGVFTYKNTTMIVNRGIGNPIIIPRLYNRPEIGLVVLRQKKTG